MGKSKKKFIDKKNAATYHVLHRSQRDVGGDGVSNTILWPSESNNQRIDQAVLTEQEGGGDFFSKLKEKVSDAGLVDEYDYDQHLKPITGTGDFFDATTGHRGDALRDPRAVPLGGGGLVQEEVNEVSRHLESIALTPECMDDDVAQALFGNFEDGDFEEVLDDFCITAAQAPEEEEEEEFDYDAHIAALMEKARKQDNQQEGFLDIREHTHGKGDADFFSKARVLGQTEEEDEEEYDDEDYSIFETPGVVAKLGKEEEKALCDKFEQTLLEYDSDEVGDLDEECEEIRGERPLEGDKQLEAAMDEFLEEKEDEVFMEGIVHLQERRRTGGSSYAALVGKNMVPAESLYENMGEMPGQDDTIQDTLAEADDILANPEMEPPQEEVLIDGKSYFSERTRNPWDCESILSTYSNLDNNPSVIVRKRKGKKKKNSQVDALPEDEIAQIQLSSKTGLPLGVLESSRTDNEYEYDDTYISVNKGEARKKKETAEEKKARKLAVKQEREIARMQKKMMKEAFKDEFVKRSTDGITNDVAGKTVFRYS